VGRQGASGRRGGFDSFTCLRVVPRGEGGSTRLPMVGCRVPAHAAVRRGLYPCRVGSTPSAGSRRFPVDYRGQTVYYTVMSSREHGVWGEPRTGAVAALMKNSRGGSYLLGAGSGRGLVAPSPRPLGADSRQEDWSVGR
jgi:hypothetical protein